jgi:hypothetical protein
MGVLQDDEMPLDNTPIHTRLIWQTLRSPFGPAHLTPSRHRPPKSSTIRESALDNAGIHTGLIWQKLRSEFGPAQLSCGVTVSS